jgi:hypothetical protein
MSDEPPTTDPAPIPTGGNPIYPNEFWPSGARRGINQVRYTHDDMVDTIVANPVISQNELAARYGYTASWVSQIITSDAFQARLHERREELTDPTIRATMKERFEALIMRSIEILNEKLNKPSDKVSDQLVLQTLGLASRSAGYGARVETPSPAPVNVHLHLNEMAGNLTQLLRREKAKVEILPEVTPDD